MSEVQEHSVRKIISGEALAHVRFGPEALALQEFRFCLNDLFRLMPPAIDIEQGFKDHDLVIEVKAVPKNRMGG